MFTGYLIKVVWVETLAFALALINVAGLPKVLLGCQILEKLFYKSVISIFKIDSGLKKTFIG